MDKLMEVLPDEVMHMRHYQGHWYKNNNLLNTTEEKEAPLPVALLKTVRSGIMRSRHSTFSKQLIYANAAGTKSKGVEWIQTVERMAK